MVQIAIFLMNLCCSLYSQIIWQTVLESTMSEATNSFNTPIFNFTTETQVFLKALYSNCWSKSLYCCPIGLKITLNICVKISGYKQLLPLMKNDIAHISNSRTLFNLVLGFFSKWERRLIFIYHWKNLYNCKGYMWEIMMETLLMATFLLIASIHRK